MDDERVDERPAGAAGVDMRRGMLRGLAAGAAALALGRFGDGAGAAKGKRKKKKKKAICERCPKMCETPNLVFCRPSFDFETEQCVCARTTAGDTVCVNIAPGLDCLAFDQCKTDAGCPANNACIKVDPVNCCPPPESGGSAPTGNLCLPICEPKK